MKDFKIGKCVYLVNYHNEILLARVIAIYENGRCDLRVNYPDCQIKVKDVEEKYIYMTIQEAEKEVERREKNSNNL